MKKSKNKNLVIVYVLLVVILVMMSLISIFVGRYKIEFSVIVEFFKTGNIGNTEKNVILFLRIPRILKAILIGAGLATSGAIYQSVFNNKLVSPDLLGVSNGACVGACASMLLGLSGLVIGLNSFIVGVVAVLITITISIFVKNKSNITYILAGIAVSGLMSSFLGLIKYLADNELVLAEMTYWLMGSLAGSSMEDIYVMAGVIVPLLVVAIVISDKINIVSLGRSDARSLGLNYNLYVVILILISTALTSASVAFCGTISWIGLVIPNIVRLIFGNNNKKVIPISMLAGSIFLLIVDMLSRSLAANEIPLSVISGIIGTPLFVFTIIKKRKDI
jgi:iron complex transport system permease protein